MVKMSIKMMKLGFKYIILIYTLFYLLKHSINYIFTGKFIQDNILQSISLYDSRSKEMFIDNLEYKSILNNNYYDSIVNSSYEIYLEKVIVVYSGYYFGLDKREISDKYYKLVFIEKKESKLEEICVKGYNSYELYGFNNSVKFHIPKNHIFPFHFKFLNCKSNVVVDSGYLIKS